jgi:hypothetical protein
MTKTKTHTKSAIPVKELLDFLSQKIKNDKEREENRRAIMTKQLHEITGGKNIVISNSR